MTHLTGRFDAAVRYASIVHGGQTRKETGIPYLAHLFAVTALVLESGGDEDQAVAAMLHDAAEDAGGRHRIIDIRSRFGDRVAHIVEVCSDTLESPKPPWRDRKAMFLERLIAADPDVLLVAAADKLHNARSMVQDYLYLGDELWGRFHAGRDGQLWYYDSLVAVLSERLPGHLTDELIRTVDRLRAISSPDGAPGTPSST